MSRVSYYRLFDSAPTGALAVELSDARRWNDLGWGIFWTVNEFNGPRRIENLARINAWAVDMDDGTKDEMRAKLVASPLIPTCIVETKRGFQAYWCSRDARAEHWNAILLDRLVPHYGADKNARDLARILRVPGFNHLKNPADPFMVRIVHKLDVSYTESQIATRYPDANAKEREAKAKAEAMRAANRSNASGVNGEGFWEQVWSLDCEEGLARLSGHPACAGERYTFRTNASGTRNILVDGKGSSCWIDRDRRIGSLSKGGPTLYAWLRWMGSSPGDAVRVLKQIFPQLEGK